MVILSRRSPGADLTGQKVRSVLSLGSGSVLTGDTDLAPDPTLNNYNNNLYSHSSDFKLITFSGKQAARPYSVATIQMKLRTHFCLAVGKAMALLTRANSESSSNETSRSSLTTEPCLVC